MKTFTIAVEWVMYGEVKVEAENLDDAIGIAQNDPEIGLPLDGEYLDGSWEVNKEITSEIN